MRMSWRIFVLCLLVGSWPSLGCVQMPGEKSVSKGRTFDPNPDPVKMQALTATDIAQTWLAQADKLQQDKKLHEAVALCEKMREPGNPQAVLATKKLALLYDRTQDLDRAEDEYKRLLQHNPKDADTLAKIGDMYYRRGMWGAAEKWYGDALAHQANHASARSGLGFALAHQGEYVKSLEEFKKVVSAADAYCEIAFVMKLQGKRQDAVRAYEEALRLEPTMARASTELSRMQTARGTEIPVHQVGRPGAAQLEDAPVRISEDTNRWLMQRPVLPPLPEVDPGVKK